MKAAAFYLTVTLFVKRYFHRCDSRLTALPPCRFRTDNIRHAARLKQPSTAAIREVEYMPSPRAKSIKNNLPGIPGLHSRRTEAGAMQGPARTAAGEFP